MSQSNRIDKRTAETAASQDWKMLDWTLPKYELDYAKVVDRTQADMEVYAQKFKLWSNAVKYKCTTEWAVVKLLEDCTVYMHALFDVKHRWYQDMVASDDYRYKLFVGANQVIGKSFLMNTQAVYSLLKDYGHPFNRAIISKSLPQARYQMTRIRDMLRRGRVDWQEQVGSSDNIMILSVNHYHPNAGKWFNISRDDRYKYTNYLICAPCTEAALGYDLHALDLDEFDWWDVDQRYTFNKILEPRTYATKGQINIYSNPNGKDRYMWELWNQKLPDGSYKWHRYSFNYWDSPNASKKEYDMLVSGKTRNEVETTLLGIFTSSEGAYFSEDEITRSYDKSLTELKMVGKQPFFFLDVGAKHDQSVLAGGYVEVDVENEKLVHLHIPIIHCYPVAYPLTRVAGVDVDESDGWHYEKSVKDYLLEWSQDGTIPIFGVDATGNSGIIPLFQAINIYPEDVIFSGPVKSGMYQRFKYYMEKGLIHRIKSPEFEYQASHLIMKKSKRGYLLIHHENEEDRDDVMDSVAGLVYLTDSPNIVEPSVMII
mgnify:FL=1